MVKHGELSEFEDLSFLSGFFEDEVREGFFVSGMMKRCWAAQLKILAEIDRICRIHDIPWMMYGGTLLGAVRHKGFIPWDDDVDIIMKRSFLERFVCVARNELFDGYRLNYTLLDGATEGISVVVSNGELSMQERVNAFLRYPFVSSVDVFALDGINLFAAV